MKKIFFIPLILSCSILILGSGSRPQENVSEVKKEPIARNYNKIIENITLSTIDNKTFAFKDLKNKIIILNFWAKWNSYCIDSIPKFTQLQNEHTSKNVQIIGIAMDHSPEDVLNFAKLHNMKYPIIMYNQELKSIFGTINNIPTTIIIDKSLNIRKKVTGFHSKAFFASEINNTEAK